MVRKINEDQFYIEYEDDIFNQDVPAVLIFTKKNHPASNELMGRLGILANKVKIMMLQMDVDEAPTLAAELGADSNETLPYVIIYEDGEIQERFEGNEYQINTLINVIEEMEEY